MELKFRKKTKSEWTVLFVLIMPFLLAFFIDVCLLPDAVKHIVDIAWIGLLISMINKKRQYITVPVKKLLIIISIFFGLTLVGFLMNFQSILYYFWGLRNNVRVFVYFFACIFFVKAESIEHYLSFFDKVFWINAIVMLYQFFIIDIKQDHLGGVFGTSRGCNGYTNIFFIVVIAKSILYCLNHKESVTKCLVKCALAVLLGALAELKVFYIELIIIVALAMCFTKTSYRKIWITVGAAVGIMIGIRLIGMLFPFFKDWFRIERIWEYVTSEKGYTLSDDVNRLTAVSIALKRFLPGIHQKLFGLGLGNCDYAAYDFLTTPFYKAYGILNYAWFSSAMIVLETGLVGMGLYIFFFVRTYLFCWKMSKDSSNDRLLCQLGMICVVMCGCLFILDASLRMESAYMLFFVLALPFIKSIAASKARSEGKVTDTEDGTPVKE